MISKTINKLFTFFVSILSISSYDRVVFKEGILYSTQSLKIYL